MPNDNYFVSVGLQQTKRKIGKTVSLYQRELFKKIPRLGKRRVNVSQKPDKYSSLTLISFFQDPFLHFLPATSVCLSLLLAP